MKKVKVQGFNPSDYAYLDSIPTEGWLWEFARRSEEYRQQYYEEEELKKDRKRYFFTMAQGLIDGQNPVPSLTRFGGKNPSEKWKKGDRIIELGVSKTSPVETVNMNLRIAHNRIQQHENIDFRIDLDGTVTITSNVPPKHPLNMLLSQQGRQNVIMALIDISAPSSVDEILDALRPQLSAWRKVLSLPNTKSAKTPLKKWNLLTGAEKIWKAYLIVYDLVAKARAESLTLGAAFEKVSDVLSQHEERYGETSLVRNQYRAAVKLIDGGYKKYI